MKTQMQTDTVMAKLNELEATCRLWIAVSGAKDERIKELEGEVHALRQRAARLGRQVGRAQGPMLGARVRSAR